MHEIVLALMVLQLLIITVIYFHGRKHVRQSLPGSAVSPRGVSCEGACPRVAMLVPLTGDTPEMRVCIDSLLRQDYPNHECVFVTKDEQDPAWTLVRELTHDMSHARGITSGPANMCGQKNHNLLAAVAAVGDSADILVFCDSTHRAAPEFLSELVRPIVKDGAPLASGFHRIVPGDAKTGTLGMTWTVLAIHMLQAFSIVTQPWGGAMAIKRDVFERENIADIWATNIVDDFSMGPHLVKRGIRCTPVSTAVMTTHISGRSTGQWGDWWLRQLQYLKFCIPFLWAGILPGMAALAVPVLYAGVVVLTGCFGAQSVGTFLFCAGYLALLALLAQGFRRLIAPRPPRLAWTGSFFLYLLMTVWCYAQTWTSNIMVWRGIAYRVGWGGVVREVIRRKTP